MRVPGIDERWWRDAIRRGEVTFFAGAGISAMAPSNLPLATGLIETILAPVLHPLALPAGLARSILEILVRLRPEVIGDVLLEHLGEDAARPILTALRGRPNAWHGLLAAALGAGCNVITTNFDTLIETAGRSLGAPIRTIVGSAIDESRDARSVLFKIHGSIGGSVRDALTSIALAVRQVGRGLSLRQTTLLRQLVETRPLVVLGYSGRDDFDILPALLNQQRTAPGLWIVHQSGAPIRPLSDDPRLQAVARPALECARAWPGALDVYSGETASMIELLRPRRGTGVLRDVLPEIAPPIEHRHPQPEAAAVALMYALVEARAFDLASQLSAHVRTTGRSARILVAHAVVLEKEGTDLRGAGAIAQKARTASRQDAPAVRALVYDQSGVIARRRGLHRLALRFYDRALEIATGANCPGWLVIQIRSHRAVALEYVGLPDEALREHRRVAAWEKRTGDLRGLAKSLNNIGITHMNQQRWKRAITAFERSTAIKRDLGDPRGIAQTLHNLGKLHWLRKDYDSAERVFLESLALRLGPGRDEHGAAQSLVALAQVAKSKGAVAAAVDYATRALEAHLRYGDQRGITQARGLLRTLAADGVP